MFPELNWNCRNRFQLNLDEYALCFDLSQILAVKDPNASKIIITIKALNII